MVHEGLVATECLEVRGRCDGVDERKEAYASDMGCRAVCDRPDRARDHVAGGD